MFRDDVDALVRALIAAGKELDSLEKKQAATPPSVTAEELWPHLAHHRIRFEDGTSPHGWENLVVVDVAALAAALAALAKGTK